MPKPGWDGRKSWNKDVQKRVDDLNKLIRWCERWEIWGDKNNNWYTERGFGRAAHYLYLAEVEIRDMQYFSDEDARRKWRRALDID